MIQAVKIDISTGHDGEGDLHYILKIIFHCIFYRKLRIFSKIQRTDT